MYIPTAIEATGAVVVAAMAFAFAGWLAGTAAYYMSLMRRSRAGLSSANFWLACLLLTLVCYGVIFMPLFRQHGPADTATALAFIAMHVVPFLAIGAHMAWCFQRQRRLRREKLLAAWRAIKDLRRPETAGSAEAT